MGNKPQGAAKCRCIIKRRASVWVFLTRGITSTVEAAMAAALAFSASSYVGSEVATL